MSIRNLFSAASVVMGWIFQIVAVGIYLLYWRVENEPGVKGDPLWLATALCLGGLGLLLFGGGNLSLFLARAKNAALVAWILVIAIALLACLASPALLIFLV